jgi:hypothetical protein
MRNIISTLNILADSLRIEGEGLAARMIEQCVEGLEQLPQPEPIDLVPNYTEHQLSQYCGKLQAIKAYRERTGQGLKDSKDAIEKYCPPTQARTCHRCGESL